MLLVVDNLWNLADWSVITWLITIPLSFFSVFIPAFFIQKLFKRDSLFRAFGIALMLGVVAAVPTSLTGTPIGVALLAWAGIANWRNASAQSAPHIAPRGPDGPAQR